MRDFKVKINYEFIFKRYIRLYCFLLKFFPVFNTSFSTKYYILMFITLTRIITKFGIKLTYHYWLSCDF